jgi:hypothetical protein
MQAAQLPKGALMSHHRRSVAVMATIAALVAVPATASAKSTDSVKPASQSVEAYVAKAQTAVKRLKRAVRAGKGSVVKRELKTARSQTAAAARAARKLTYAASSDPQEVAATHALTLAGTQYDALIESITALVDEISGQAQALMAQAIAPSIAGKQQIIDLLTSMLDKVPADVKPVLASVIAGLSVGDASEVANLDDAVDSGALPVDISAIVTQALNLATTSIQSAFGLVQSLLPMMPEAAQAPLGAILDMVTSTVGTILPSVLTTVTGLIDSVLGSLPFVGRPTATGSFGLGGLLGGLVGDGADNVPGGFGTTISNLLGGLFGGGAGQPGGTTPKPAGTTPAGSGTTPATGGLLGGGIGGIINSVTGIINGVLGGLFGHAVPAT